MGDVIRTQGDKLRGNVRGAFIGLIADTGRMVIGVGCSSLLFLGMV